MSHAECAATIHISRAADLFRLCCIVQRATQDMQHTIAVAALRVAARQHTLARQVVRFRAESVAPAAALATDGGESARRSEAHETGLRKVSGLSHLAVPT
jgi:hypothetical protein